MSKGDAGQSHVVMVGGGSGGHITPLLAVAHQVKRLRPESTISYVGQTGDGLGDIPANDPDIDRSYTVRAGKFRRYHGEGWRQVLDLPTLGKNLRDVFYVLIGLLQSLRLLRMLKPDVVFIKGGFVGVPVGLAAAMLRIPYVTHDSDAIPGLANRIVARWAALHAVALPADVYAYPSEKTVSVGVPVSHEFRPRNDRELATLRRSLGIPPQQRLVLVTGGGLGAQRLNDAVVAMAPKLLAAYPDVGIVHLAGRTLALAVEGQYEAVLPAAQRQRVEVIGFTTELYKFSALAEVVVTRAGGNSIAEFAAQGKACVVVPNPVLTGGHQTKNAKVLADRKAVLLVEEPAMKRDALVLMKAVGRVLDDAAEASRLSGQLQTVAKPDAAVRLAMLLLEQSSNHTNDNIQKHDIPS